MCPGIRDFQRQTYLIFLSFSISKTKRDVSWQIRGIQILICHIFNQYPVKGCTDDYKLIAWCFAEYIGMFCHIFTWFSATIKLLIFSLSFMLQYTNFHSPRKHLYKTQSNPNLTRQRSNNNNITQNITNKKQSNPIPPQLIHQIRKILTYPFMITITLQILRCQPNNKN